jgi:hypothetical protein
MSEGDHRQIQEPAAQKLAHRCRAGLLLCAVVGAVLLFMTWQAERRGVPADPEYVWTLSFPGTPPGVRFDTKRGDDLTSAVESSLPEDQAAWQETLATTGELEIGLSCKVERRVPLRTRICWWRMDRRWRPARTAVGVGLPGVRLRTVARTTPTYEVLRHYRAEEEWIAGPFLKYEEARQAAVAEIAKMMDRFQKGETIEGRDDWFPAEP